VDENFTKFMWWKCD